MHKETALNYIKRQIGDQNQDVVAKKVGISRQTLNEALNGHLDPLPRKLLKHYKIGLVTKHTYIHLDRI